MRFPHSPDSPQDLPPFRSLSPGGGSLSSRLEELRSESLSLSLETTGRTDTSKEVTATGHRQQARCMGEWSGGGGGEGRDKGHRPSAGHVFGARGPRPGNGDGRLLLSASQEGSPRGQPAPHATLSLQLEPVIPSGEGRPPEPCPRP